MTAPIMVLGASGMLGHRLVRHLARRRPVVAVSRCGDGGRARAAGATDARLADLSAGSLARLLEAHGPAVVINAIGVVKQRPEATDAVTTIAVNSLFPHELARVCAVAGCRLIHFSTDCVFSGARGGYREEDDPDPVDLYGRSKLLGEVIASGTLTLRTSMIGPEIGSRRGLLEWARSQRGGAVRGFRRAVFSGLPTVTLAAIVERLIAEFPRLSGLYHVAADPISKFDLLRLLNDRYRLGLTIEPADVPVCNRSLDGSRFRAATGFVAESWRALIDRMAEDEERTGV